jgi:hypothetical protein
MIFNNNILKIIGTASICGLAMAAGATLVNPGFENGNLNGWTESLNGGSASVVTTHTAYDGFTFTVPNGSYFLDITGSTSSYGLDWATVSQTFSLSAGDVVVVWAGFDVNGKDAAPAAQWTWNGSPMWSKDGTIDFHTYPNHSDWSEQVIHITATGDYTLSFMYGASRSDYPSAALFDVAVMTVPEPSTWVSGAFALLLAGYGDFEAGGKKQPHKS